MTEEHQKLHDFLESVDEGYHGDVGFIPPISLNLVELFEKSIDWQLPSIYKFFLANESNGIIIGKKRILSLNDSSQKKTWSDNLERNNNPKVSFSFKERPLIFKNYLIIGTDGEICFCYSKKYDLANPLVYICEDANSKLGVNFERLDLDLEGLIGTMISGEIE